MRWQATVALKGPGTLVFRQKANRPSEISWYHTADPDASIWQWLMLGEHLGMKWDRRPARR